MIEATDVSFKRAMPKFASGGSTTRSACGRMTQRMAESGVMPTVSAASIWPPWMERIPARKISAMYAAPFNPSR